MVPLKYFEIKSINNKNGDLEFYRIKKKNLS